MLASISVLTALGLWWATHTPEVADANTFWFWTERIRSTGVAAGYAGTEPLNYPPLALYLFRLWDRWIQAAGPAMAKQIGFLALAGQSLVLWNWLLTTGRRTVWALLPLLNPAFIYCSLYWGQIDAVVGFWVLLALLSLERDRPLLSSVAMASALMTKLTVAIVLPIWLLALVFCTAGRPRQLLDSAAMFVLVCLAWLGPVIWANQLPAMLQSMVGTHQANFHHLSINAYNAWYLPGTDWGKRPMQDMAGPLNLGQWASLLCVLAYGSALLLWARQLLVLWQNGETLMTAHTWAGAGFIGMLVFYLAPGMHERYVDPALIPVMLTAAAGGRLWPLILLSTAYTLNLDYLDMNWMGQLAHRLTWMPQTVALLYLLGILLLLPKPPRTVSAKG